MRLGIKGCTAQAVLEAHGTAASPLRLVLQSRHGTAPSGMVVFVLHIGHALRLQETYQFLLAHFILLQGIDVGIGKKHGGTHVIAEHTFHDGGGTGRTTGMEQHGMTLSLATVR